MSSGPFKTISNSEQPAGGVEARRSARSHRGTSSYVLFPMTAPVKHVWAALLVVYFVWGSTYFGIKIAVETIPPLFAAGVAS